jgi:hypothetical protein
VLTARLLTPRATTENVRQVQVETTQRQFEIVTSPGMLGPSGALRSSNPPMLARSGNIHQQLMELFSAGPGGAIMGDVWSCRWEERYAIGYWDITCLPLETLDNATFDEAVVKREGERKSTRRMENTENKKKQEKKIQLHPCKIAVSYPSKHHIIFESVRTFAAVR